jgi:hypothetical protein
MMSVVGSFNSEREKSHYEIEQEFRSPTTKERLSFDRRSPDWVDRSLRH